MRMTTAEIALVIMLLVSGVAPSFAESWQGVDETVVEKYAAEHDREACAPFINIEGDALLFAFLLAGAAGGFVMGYFYRDVVGKKSDAGRGRGVADAR